MDRDCSGFCEERFDFISRRSDCFCVGQVGGRRSVSAIDEFTANRTQICIVRCLAFLRSVEEILVLEAELVIERRPFGSQLEAH